MSKIVATQAWLGVLMATGAMIVLAATGCTTGPPRSGFLSDYSGFEEAPEDALIWEYMDPDERVHRLHVRIWEDRRNGSALGKYERIVIDPVRVDLRPGSRAVWADPEQLDRLTQYMYDAAVTGLEDRYRVVDEPGEGVLRLRGAITDARAEIQYATPDLDGLPEKAWANSRPGGLSAEGELVDSVSGKRIIGLILLARGSYYDAFEPGDRWEHSRRAIDGLIRYIRKQLDEEHRPD